STRWPIPSPGCSRSAGARTPRPCSSTREPARGGASERVETLGPYSDPNLPLVRQIALAARSTLLRRRRSSAPRAQRPPSAERPTRPPAGARYFGPLHRPCHDGGMVDWTFASRLAGTIAGEPPYRPLADDLDA